MMVSDYKNIEMEQIHAIFEQIMTLRKNLYLLLDETLALMPILREIHRKIEREIAK